MDARLLRIDQASYRREDVSDAARALAEGALVAFPTETVYAVGGRRDDDAATERLRRLRGGNADRPLTLLAPSVEAALADVERVPARALPLMRRFWPGPVTIVFPGSPHGVRVPAHPVAHDLLDLARVPVLTAGAAPEGEEPLTTGEATAARLAGQVDWIVDAGDTPLREPSTVVRVADEGWECLREGIVSRDILARHLTTSIVFVCTGNSCRSPMAEALFRRKVAQRIGVDEEGLERAGVVIASAGTSAQDGGPASSGAVHVMEERAIDLGRHRARTIDEEIMERASAIYTLSPGHAATLREWWPEHAGKVQPLDDNGILDPIGGPSDLYRQCAEAIERRLDELLERLFPEALLRPRRDAD